MIDLLDASSDQLRLAVARSFLVYSTPTLIELLSDDNVIVRTSAARELQTRGGVDVFQAGLAAARHPRFEMREIAAFLLGQLGTPKCPYAEMTYPILVSLLDDPYYEVVAASVRAFGSLASLGHFANDEIFAMVRRLETADKSDVRGAVAYSLGFLDDDDGKGVLERLACDCAIEVRDVAEFSLELRADRTTPTG